MSTTNSNLLTPSTILTALGALTMVAWPSLVLLDIHSPLTAAVSLVAWSAIAVIPYRQLQHNFLPWLLTAWAGAAGLLLAGWGSWRFSLYGVPVTTHALAWLLYFPTATKQLDRLYRVMADLVNGFADFMYHFLLIMVPTVASLTVVLGFGYMTLPHFVHTLGDMLFWGYFILMMGITMARVA